MLLLAPPTSLSIANEMCEDDGYFFSASLMHNPQNSLRPTNFQRAARAVF
jgi:hypothetical protein